MSMAQALLPEFDQEMANTRKTLARVPENKLNWTPDPKSMNMGRLAGHIAEMPGWAVLIMQMDSFDVAPVGGGGHQPLIATSQSQLVSEFDKNIASARAAIAGASDEALMKPWTLKA